MERKKRGNAAASKNYVSKGKVHFLVFSELGGRRRLYLALVQYPDETITILQRLRRKTKLARF